MLPVLRPKSLFTDCFVCRLGLWTHAIPAWVRLKRAQMAIDGLPLLRRDLTGVFYGNLAYDLALTGNMTAERNMWGALFKLSLMRSRKKSVAKILCLLSRLELWVLADCSLYG